MNAYFQAQGFSAQISKRAYENLHMFLSFAGLLREKRSNYNQEQLKNVLILYIEVFNTLLLEYDYMYYGNIRTQYQQTEAKNFLCQDDRGTSKSKASYIWLEKQEKLLIKKKFDEETKDKFKNIRRQNEEFGYNINNDFRKYLREDIKDMEESGFAIHKTDDHAIQIKDISYRGYTVCAQQNTITESSMIKKRLGFYVKDSNQQSNCLKSATTHPKDGDDVKHQKSNFLMSAKTRPTIIEEQSEACINNNDADDDDDDDDGDDDVKHQKSNNLKSAIEKQSCSNDDDGRKSAETNQSAFLQNPEDENSSAMIIRPNNSVHNFEEELSLSFNDQISLRDQHVAVDTYSIMLHSFHSQFQCMVVNSMQKKQQQHRLAAKLVRTFAALNKTLARVLPDMDCQATIAKESIVAKENSSKNKATTRRIKIYCRQELFEILSLMISFCKAILQGNREELLEYLVTDDDIDSVLQRSSNFADFISREDELLVSFYMDKLYSKRTSLYDLVINNSDSFLTKSTTIDILKKHNHSSAVVERAKHISKAVIEFTSESNPFKSKSSLSSASLPPSLPLSPSLTKITKPTTGPRLNADGQAVESKKRTIGSLPEMKIAKIKKTKVENQNIEDSTLDDSDGDYKSVSTGDIDSKLLESENEDVESENEVDLVSNINKMPTLFVRMLFVRMLRTYRKQDRFDPNEILQQYLVAAINEFGRENVHQTLMTMPEQLMAAQEMAEQHVAEQPVVGQEMAAKEKQKKQQKKQNNKQM